MRKNIHGFAFLIIGVLLVTMCQISTVFAEAVDIKATVAAARTLTLDTTLIETILEEDDLVAGAKELLDAINATVKNHAAGHSWALNVAAESAKINKVVDGAAAEATDYNVENHLQIKTSVTGATTTEYASVSTVAVTIDGKASGRAKTPADGSVYDLDLNMTDIWTLDALVDGDANDENDYYAMRLIFTLDSL